MRSDGDTATHARDLDPAVSWVALLLVTALAAFLRLRLINAESLWMDEAASMHFARQPLMDLLRLVYEYESNPPLHYLLLHASIAVFGDTDFAGRFPSAVFGTLTVPAVFFLARQFTSRFGALTAAAFLGLSWVHIYYSVEARAYALLILLAVLSSHAFLKLISTPHRRWIFAYAITAIAMIWTHYHAAAVLWAHVIMVIAQQWKQPAVLRRSAVAMGAIMLAGAPLVPWVLRTSRRLGGDRIPPDFSDAVQRLTVFCDYAGSWIVLVMLIPLAAVALFGRSVRFDARLLVLGLLTLPVLIPWTWWLTGGALFVPRYGVVTVAAFSLIVGVGVTLVPRAAPLVAIALLLAAGLSLVNASEKFRKPEWRHAANDVAKRAAAGDTVVVSLFYNGFSFDRYFPRTDLRRRNYDDFTVGQVVRGQDGMQRLWLVLNPMPSDLRFLEIDNPMRDVSRTEFFQVTVVELERKPE